MGTRVYRNRPTRARPTRRFVRRRRSDTLSMGGPESAGRGHARREHLYRVRVQTWSRGQANAGSFRGQPEGAAELGYRGGITTLGCDEVRTASITMGGLVGATCGRDEGVARTAVGPVEHAGDTSMYTRRPHPRRLRSRPQPSSGDGSACAQLMRFDWSDARKTIHHDAVKPNGAPARGVPPLWAGNNSPVRRESPVSPTPTGSHWPFPDVHQFKT